MLCSYAPKDLRIQLCTLVTAESLGNMDLPSLSVFPILLSPQFLEVSVGGFSMAVRWLPCNNLRIAFSTFPIHSNLRIVFSVSQSGIAFCCQLLKCTMDEG